MWGVNMTEVGACYLGSGRYRFRVWAPFADEVELKIHGASERFVSLEREEHGYWKIELADILPGTRYFFRINKEKERPDPASRFQPLGVHGPSQVIDPEVFAWQDADWNGLPLETYVIYEIHVGTFTKEGTFDAIIPRLAPLQELGITAIEIMPVAQFPGTRNWGYDGAHPYAVQNSYGGPEGLKRLVNASHQKGIAVVLDVVYNHLGPEGNYLSDYGPYFTDHYKTPWGNAVNFDGRFSDEVRNFFVQNALQWVRDYHIDALRLDAIHSIFDFSAKHFLEELGEAVHHESEVSGRKIYVIPESDLNDVRIINPQDQGGYGLDAQWNDDFHHCVHAILTGERTGYYADYGTVDQMEKAFREGFVYSGGYSDYRKRRHGNSAKSRSPRQFVVFSQNHDQIGNRMFGNRLSQLASFEALKLAAASVILSPSIPLFFMGEEYGEEAPFLYFISHGDAALVEAIRNGRKKEFSSFSWSAEPPDPQDEKTFQDCKIDWDKRNENKHGVLLRCYTALLELRALHVSLRGREDVQVHRIGEGIIALEYGRGNERTWVFFNFADNECNFSLPAGAGGTGVKIFDSSDLCWNGPAATAPASIHERESAVMRATSAAVYTSLPEAR